MNITAPPPDHEDFPDPPPADVLAGEYVLGVLNATQRREAQARIERDPAFARLVEGWEKRLAALTDEIAPAAPPAHLWPRIRTRIGWSPIENECEQRAWRRVGFWQSVAGLAAAAAVAAVFFGRVQPPPTPPPVVITEPQPMLPVTALAREDGSAGWLASVDAGRGKLWLMPVPGPDDNEDRAPELWLIAPGEAPRSLGLLPIGKTCEIDVPEDLRRALAEGSLLAVSLEPPTGAPHGAPTGPIVAKGGIVRI